MIIKEVFSKFIADKDPKKLLKILLVGEMGTGKTTITVRLLELLYEVLSKEKVRVAYTQSEKIEETIEALRDSDKLVYLILDDPDYDSIARNKMKITKTISQIRHIINNDVILVTISHGLRLLPPLLRSSDINIYTSIFNNFYENRELRYELGDYFYEKLEKITYDKKIERKSKGCTIVKIIAMKPQIICFEKPSLDVDRIIEKARKIFKVTKDIKVVIKNICSEIEISEDELRKIIDMKQLSSS